MKFFDRIKKGLNPDEDESFGESFNDDEIYDENYGNIGDLGDFISPGGYSPYGAQNGQGGIPQNQQQPYQNNMAPTNNGGLSVVGGTNMQFSVELKVIKPEDYKHVNEIADHLLNKKTVILNLEDTNKETARRLIDFLTGVAYAIGGQIERVSERTFVITPSDVMISPEQAKEETRKSDSSLENSIY